MADAGGDDPDQYLVRTRLAELDRLDSVRFPERVEDGRGGLHKLLLDSNV
jgi:hypothetical protein